MSFDTVVSNPMAPHGAVIDLRWSVHEVKPDGQYKGFATDSGRAVFDLKGDDQALAIERLQSLIDLIRRNANDVSQLEIDEERLRQARIQGSSGPRTVSPGLFGMRGTFNRDNSG